MVAALQEAGLEIVGTSVKKSTKEDKERIKEIMGEDAHMIDDMTPREMYAMLRDAKADIMLSGGRSQFVALKARCPGWTSTRNGTSPSPAMKAWWPWSRKSTRRLSNPIWRQVRLPAPWDAPASQPCAEVAAE